MLFKKIFVLLFILFSVNLYSYEVKINPSEKLEINIFGYTYHFKHAKNKYPKQVFNSNNVFNPGIGINYYFHKKYFITFNYLKNCWNGNTYITGVNKNFNIYKNLNFDFGINYIISKYNKYIKKILPLYSVNFRLNSRLNLKVSYIPQNLSINKKSEFVFCFLTYKLF